MIYFKPDDYDSFTCMAGQCPDTCCAGWRIEIDDESLGRYLDEKSLFGNRLVNSIDWTDSVFRQYEHQCVLLDEQGLCELHKNLGADALCETCRIYPRHVEEYDGVREYSLSLSCPRAAQMLLERKRPLAFVFCETDETDDFEDFDTALFEMLVKARKQIFNLLQDRRYFAEQRMTVALHIAEKIQSCIDTGRLEDADNVLNSAKAGKPQMMLVPAVSFHEMYRQFDIFYRLDRQREEWDDLLDLTYDIFFRKGEMQYAECYKNFHKKYGCASPYQKEWELCAEQLAVYFLYTYFLGAVYDDDVYAKVSMSVFSVRWIQTFVIASVTAENSADAAGNRETFPFSKIRDRIVRITYRYARELEHSDYNLDTLEAFCHDIRT